MNVLQNMNEEVIKSGESNIKRPERRYYSEDKNDPSLSKRIIHKYPENAVEMLLCGIQSVHPALSVDLPTKTIYLNKKRGNKFALLSGGGSGHEPFCAGFVGENMLTGCVAGSVFASPPTQCILTAIQHLSDLNLGGVLVVHMNYTGDVINFGIAVEEAKARGLNVELFVVADDIATIGMDSIAGRRGIVGTLFIFKILGGMSSAGKSLKITLDVCKLLSSRIASLGVCLSACSLPGRPPMFHIPSDKIHLGVGIHGEAGVSSLEMLSAEEMVKLILAKIKENLQLKIGSEVAVVINNLGTMTPIEMYLVANLVHNQLGTMECKVLRMYCGSFQTSLDMNGFHISVLDCSGYSDEWLPWLDKQTEAFAWPSSSLSFPQPDHLPSFPLSLEERQERASKNSIALSSHHKEILINVLRSIAKYLLDNEAELNRLDSGIGDGDTGSTLAAFAKRIQVDFEKTARREENLGDILFSLSKMAEKEMGGVSGGLYSLMILGAARSSHSFSTLLDGSIHLMSKYTTARVGDRTMLDALVPANEAFKESLVITKNDWKESFNRAVEAAKKGAQSTKKMAARAGRASYVDPSLLVDVDAGAQAVVIWLTAIKEALEK